MCETDEHLRHAGQDVADADDEEQPCDRQRRVQHARQHDAENILQRVLDREIGVGLLQPLLLDDVGHQRPRGRGEDPADRAAEDADREEDRGVRVRPAEQEHQQRRQEDQAALREVADDHDLHLVPAVAQHAAERRHQQEHRAAEGQIQALQEGVVAADLEDVKADGEAVEHRAELRDQRAEKDEPEVPFGKDVFARRFSPHRSAFSRGAARAGAAGG